MSFRLINALATFQAALMNFIFGPYLRRFVVVFFDGILVFSSSREEHMEHLAKVFEILQVNKLYPR